LRLRQQLARDFHNHCAVFTLTAFILLCSVDHPWQLIDHHTDGIAAHFLRTQKAVLLFKQLRNFTLEYQLGSHRCSPSGTSGRTRSRARKNIGRPPLSNWTAQCRVTGATRRNVQRSPLRLTASGSSPSEGTMIRTSPARNRVSS